MDAGIKFIKIIGEKNDMQFQIADACSPFSIKILRYMFNNVGMNLMPGEDIIECTKQEISARYDMIEGIDILLKFEDNTKGTLQQKILFTDYKTVTFEEYKNSGKQGAWYYCTAQYYFIIYTKQSRYEIEEQYKSNKMNPEFREAYIYNLPEIHRLSLNGQIDWDIKENYNYRNNSFRWTHFIKMPDSCIIAKWINTNKFQRDLQLNLI